MKTRPSLFVPAFLLAMSYSTPTSAKAPPSYDEARQAAWTLTSTVIESLEEGDAKAWPGTQAWLKDFRERTKGIDKEVPPAKWPKVDVGALVEHNPNYWRMVFEIAPGDPTLTVVYSGLLLSQGEAKRAAYAIELGRHWPGIPREVRQGLGMLQNTAMAALGASNDLTEQGTKRFDGGDYDGALKKYREAQTACPTNGWTWYEIGYTLRTQAAVARGEPLDKPGTVKINAGANDGPDVIAALAEARLHDPLQVIAWQGSDPAVIKGFAAIAKRVMPAWKALREAGADRAAEFRALREISDGFGEAGVHDLAILARQLMAARRNSYDPSDFPIFAASLRRLAPGAEIEGILARLAGEKGKEILSFRVLTKQEQEEGQPALGSGERLYVPDKAPPKADADQPVHLDLIRLITSEDEVAKRTTVEQFAKFSKDFQKIAEEVLGKCEKPCRVLVHFKCAPSGHTVEVMHQPKEVDRKPLEDLQEALKKLDKLAVKETVEFQLQFTVTPKKGR